MSLKITRRALLGGLLSGAALPLQASPPAASLKPRLRPPGLGQPPGPDDLVEAAARAGLTGRNSFALAGPDGALIEGMATGTAMPPASVGKCLTTLYALEMLGPDHRFATRVMTDGTLRDGRLEGDLWLVGGGDPGLDTTDLADLAAQLKEAGLHEVTGRFRYHGGALPEARLIDAAQPDHVSYNPGVSALNLNYNRVHFEWTRQAGDWAVAMDARTRGYRPEVAIATMRVVERSSPVYTYADRDGHDTWSVARGALGTGGARWLPVRRPAAYAAEVFATLARSHGIVLKTPGEADALPAGMAELARHESPPLDEIAELMLRYSNNLTAELLGLSATAAGFGRPASIRASARQMSAWARETLGLADVAMVDHSGLGDASRISVADLARMLSHPRTRRRLHPLLKPVKLKDQRGRLIPDPAVSVDAKTGTLNFVSGLAGYIVGPDGRQLSFAILSCDMDRRDGLSRAQRERPPGGRSWLVRARRLQQALLSRWGDLYGTA